MQQILNLIEMKHMRDKIFIDSNIILYSYSKTELNNNFKIINFSLITQIKAIKIKKKYKFQYYDSLILATALENNCTILYSENMQHEQIIEN